MVTSFVVYTLGAVLVVAPKLRTRDRLAAIYPLLWVHMFRTAAMGLFISQESGLEISDGLRNEIAYGDYAGLVVAIAAILAIRFAPQIAIPIVWVLVVVTVIDLANAAIGGVDEELFSQVDGIPWATLAFYVPLLWVTTGLMVWQLITRRGEPINPSTSA